MDLDRFNKLLENQKDIEDNSPSFLEVIGRYYDENIISRYLLYILFIYINYSPSLTAENKTWIFLPLSLSPFNALCKASNSPFTRLISSVVL